MGDERTHLPEAHMIEAIVIGASAGGVEALNRIFGSLPENFPIPIVTVLHIGETRFISEAFHANGLKVREADEKEFPQKGTIYFAPADYHLLSETDHSFSLTTEEKVNFARPSIDVTFESFADVYKDKLLGIVLTGANQDGAQGLRCIRKRGGKTLVQDPAEAAQPEMPRSALDLCPEHEKKSLNEITEYLRNLYGGI